MNYNSILPKIHNLLTALELMELGHLQMKQNIKRIFNSSDEAFIDDKFKTWLVKQPKNYLQTLMAEAKPKQQI